MTVWSVAGDVGDAQFIAALLDQIEARCGQLHGVIHAAGVLADGLICRKSLAEVREILWPKVQGTLVLDRLTRDRKLDFFVACSSTAALEMLAGQASYAAANAYLDLTAQARDRAGSPALSINWGVWGQTQVVVVPAIGDSSQPTACALISHQAGVRGLLLALGQHRPQLVINRLTGRRLRSAGAATAADCIGPGRAGGLGRTAGGLGSLGRRQPAAGPARSPLRGPDPGRSGLIYPGRRLPFPAADCPSAEACPPLSAVITPTAAASAAGSHG